MREDRVLSPALGEFKKLPQLLAGGGLLRRPEHHIVNRAGHYAFLPPCGEALAKQAGDIVGARKRCLGMVPKLLIG